MNSELYGKTYKVPSEVLNHIQVTLTSYPNNDGVRRAKNIVKSGYITYQNLKRLKNYFDYFNNQNGDIIQYNLAGGDKMRGFVEQTLNKDRDTVELSKENRRDIKYKTNNNSELKPHKIRPRLNEGNINVKHNALAVIINNEGKILLLKRNGSDCSWGSNQWALVAGGIEEGETPEESCKREIFEETGLNINDFSKRFVIQRNPDSIEYVFACVYDGNEMDVELNNEHNNFGWFGAEELNYLDTVPNLSDYVNLTLTNY